MKLIEKYFLNFSLSLDHVALSSYLVGAYNTVYAVHSLHFVLPYFAPLRSAKHCILLNIIKNVARSPLLTSGIALSIFDNAADRLGPIASLTTLLITTDKRLVSGMVMPTRPKPCLRSSGSPKATLLPFLQLFVRASPIRGVIRNSKNIFPIIF